MRVLFDDGNTYLGIIVRKDPETDMWVTVFEDGEEDPEVFLVFFGFYCS